MVHDVFKVKGNIEGSLLAETEEGNVFVGDSLSQVSEDFSIDLSEERNCNLSIDLNLVSVTIDLDGGRDVLVGGQG